MTEQPDVELPSPYAAPWMPSAQPAQVPGTVTAAAIVTYVCAAISAAITVLMLLFAIFVGRFMLPAFSGPDRNELVLFVLGGVAFSFAASALASWLAWQTGRRKGWARVALAACSGLTAAWTILALSPLTLVPLAGSVAVLVLLFVPDTNSWFRDA